MGGLNASQERARRRNNWVSGAVRKSQRPGVTSNSSGSSSSSVEDRVLALETGPKRAHKDSSLFVQVDHANSFETELTGVHDGQLRTSRTVATGSHAKDVCSRSLLRLIVTQDIIGLRRLRWTAVSCRLVPRNASFKFGGVRNSRDDRRLAALHGASCVRRLRGKLRTCRTGMCAVGP